MCLVMERIRSLRVRHDNDVPDVSVMDAIGDGAGALYRDSAAERPARSVIILPPRRITSDACG